MKRLRLPDAPADQTGLVKVWTEAVMIPTYHPLPPDKNPMFLEKRVYQGSSGRVYPLPFADRIARVSSLLTRASETTLRLTLRLVVTKEIGRAHV